MTEQDYAAKVRALTEAAEDAIALLSAYFLDGPPEEPDSTIRALERARDAILAAPAPSEPGLASDHPDCGGYCDCYFRGRLRG